MRKKIVIVEDDPDLAENYAEILGMLGYHVMGCFDNAPNVLYFLKANKPDLMLVDIKIKGEFDGIALAKVVQKDHGIPVIFTTAFSDDQTLAHALQTGPINYLVKPISRENFKTALYLAFSTTKQANAEGDTKRLKIRDKGHVCYLFMDEIVFLKAEGLYTLISTKSNISYLERKILKDMLVGLPSSQFIRVHKSYVINLTYVKSLSSKYIILGDTLIPIRRGFYSELKNILSGLNNLEL